MTPGEGQRRAPRRMLRSPSQEPCRNATLPAAGRGQSRPGRHSAAGPGRACAAKRAGRREKPECYGCACVAGRWLDLMGGGAFWLDPRASRCSVDHPDSVPLSQLPPGALSRPLKAAFQPSPRGLRTLLAALRSAAVQDA